MNDKALSRFLSKINIDSETRCWNWLSAIKSDGYGQFWYNRTTVLPHRLSYEHFVGNIPSGLFVCHVCDNRCCVNPEHLWLGTAEDNRIDMINKGRELHRHGEDHCNSKLTEEDVGVIRHMYDNKERFNVTQQSLADLFGVCSMTINEIVRRKNWKHI